MTKNQTARAGFDLGRWLVYGAAAFQAYHMGRAFHVYDPDGWHLMRVNFGGLLLGAILNVIVAQTAMRLPGISATFAALKALLPRAAKKADRKDEQARARALKKMTMAMKQNVYSQVGFYILLGFSALMVGPALFILWTKTMPFPPLFVGILAAVGAVAPDVAITVGGFAASDAQRRSATLGATVSDAGSDIQRPNQRRPARKSATGSDVPAKEAKIYRCVCGEMTTTNRYEYSGHARTCEKFKAYKAAKVAIPVDLGATSANAERGSER